MRRIFIFLDGAQRYIYMHINGTSRVRLYKGTLNIPCEDNGLVVILAIKTSAVASCSSQMKSLMIQS